MAFESSPIQAHPHLSKHGSRTHTFVNRRAIVNYPSEKHIWNDTMTALCSSIRSTSGQALSFDLVQGDRHPKITHTSRDLETPRADNFSWFFSLMLYIVSQSRAPHCCHIRRTYDSTANHSYHTIEMSAPEPWRRQGRGWMRRMYGGEVAFAAFAT